MRARSLFLPALAIVFAVSACDRKPSREKFGFVYETGYGYKVDTFEGIITKDLVCKPDTTIHLKLTDVELAGIRAKIDEMRFLRLPEPCPAQDAKSFSIPHTTVTLKVVVGDRSKELHWDTRHSPDKATKDDWKAIYALINLIRDTVESHPEYQALPEATGGYL